MGCKTSFVDVARACTTSLVQFVPGRGLGISFPYGLIAGSAGRVCAIAAACHSEIYMTINATEACVKVIIVARPAMSALVFLFLCRADFVRRVSESTSDKGASAKDSGGSTCCEHQKHRIQCKDSGGSSSQNSRKETL